MSRSVLTRGKAQQGKPVSLSRRAFLRGTARWSAAAAGGGLRTCGDASTAPAGSEAGSSGDDCAKSGGRPQPAAAVSEGGSLCALR